jgi:hypothetical protein
MIAVKNPVLYVLKNDPLWDVLAEHHPLALFGRMIGWIHAR